MQVDPTDVDLSRFRDAVTRGRKKLAAGDAEAAASLLDEALRLWQGPVLADLVEQGLSWPELNAVNEARLDALEDWFDAELQCGRHQTILGELQAFVSGCALRERACGQLMVALYRCGRQAEALDVYAGMRKRLTDELGLEPGQDLRRLQHAILNQELELAAPIPTGIMSQPAARAPAVLAGSAAGVTVSTTTPTGIGRDFGHPEDRSAVETLIPVQRGASVRGAGTSRQVSVLVVRGAPTEETLRECMDEMLAAVAAGVCAEVERAGGVLVSSIGSMSVAVFGAPNTHSDDTSRAVRAATAVRDRFNSALVIRATVTTGMLRASDGDAISGAVTSMLVDHCLQLLAFTNAGEIRVCESTRRDASGAFVYRPVDDASESWLVDAVPSEAPVTDDEMLHDRDSETVLVASVVERAGHRRQPHLLTVMGEAGTGKSRFLAKIRQQHDAAILPAGLPLHERPLALHAELLGARLDISLDDPPAIVRARLASELCDLSTGHKDVVEQLLGMFIGRDRPRPAVMEVWAQAMSDLHRGRPLVVVVDDLHKADDATMDAVFELVARPWRLPICIVAGARTSLLNRRPGWGTGIAQSVTITLDPPDCDRRTLERWIGPTGNQ